MCLVCVCACDAVAQSDRYSVEQVRLAHTEMRPLSSIASLPVQPRLTVSCLTHGLGLMHMEEGKERKNKNNNYLCMCVSVCVFHSTYHSQPLYSIRLFTFICILGLTLSFSPQLIPQFFFVAVGVTGASCYLVRLAKGPHVT